MPAKRTFPHEIDHKIRVKIKKIKDAKALRRLMALNMYRQGKSNKEIAEATGYHKQHITHLVTEVLQKGLDTVLQDGRKSNNYRMTYEQETELKKVVLAFEDEAGFGRILGAASCWAPPRQRPVVPGEIHREYKTVICCDRAGWHTTNKLKIPKTISLFFLPPSTPEMNPIEQIWKEIRKRGFKNIMFKSLDDLFAMFWIVVANLVASTVTSITARDWVIQSF
jgi:transposase